MCLDRKLVLRPPHRVVLNDEVSDQQNVTSDVPQESGLGPTLLFKYVNDLESNLLSKVAKFTDNTN